MIKKSSIVSIALAVILMVGCDQSTSIPNLQSGDIVFVSSTAKGLAGAINDVTKEEETLDYVHMAIVELAEGDTFLLHADTDRGVSREPVANFIERYPNTVVYRIPQLEKASIDQALSIAKSHIGKPYNFSFYNDDSALYCSQLVYLAFEQDSIFSLNSMTFKNPESNSFNDFWTQYYDSLGVNIPEGVKGCNPNHMSQNNHLQRLGRLE